MSTYIVRTRVSSMGWVAIVKDQTGKTVYVTSNEHRTEEQAYRSAQKAMARWFKTEV